MYINSVSKLREPTKKKFFFFCFYKMKFPVEIITEILSNLDNNSLYSCLFVNKMWSGVSAVLLWKNPFSNRDSTAAINTLIHQLINEDGENKKLIPYEIPFSNELEFNYKQCIREFDSKDFVQDFEKWFNDKHQNNLGGKLTLI